jgi:hypothetical protein
MRAIERRVEEREIRKIRQRKSDSNKSLVE